MVSFIQQVCSLSCVPDTGLGIKDTAERTNRTHTCNHQVPVLRSLLAVETEQSTGWVSDKTVARACLCSY